MTIAIGLIGAAGRMGRALCAQVLDEPAARLAGGIDRAGHPDLGRPLSPDTALSLSDDGAALAAASDVLIDFTVPAGLERALQLALGAGRPIVVGTTGLEPQHHKLLAEAAQRIPVLWSANMSLGVTLLAALVRQAAQRLGEDWDIEILEMHHRAKIDAPSGTALMLGEAAAAGRGVSLAQNRVSVRDGITGARKAGDIGFATLRGGSVAGDHLVMFAANQERLELGHRAESRAIFARGAVRAALWLAGRPPGLYGMTDVLELPA